MVGALQIAKPGSDGTAGIEWEGDAPFFASCRMPIVLLHAPGVRNEKECKQADNRVSYLDFKEEVPEEVRALKIRPCGRCGAKLYLEGKAQNSAAHVVGQEAAAGDGEGPPKRERERTGGIPPRSTTSRTSTFEQLQQLMEWQREGLLSAVEFQKAKEQILGEEPSLPCMACVSASLETVDGVPDQ